MFGNVRSFDGFWSEVTSISQIAAAFWGGILTVAFMSFPPTRNAVLYLYAEIYARKHSWEECHPHKGYGSALRLIGELGKNNSEMVSARDIREHVCWSTGDIMKVCNYMKLRGWVNIDKPKDVDPVTYRNDPPSFIFYSLTTKGNREYLKLQAIRKRQIEHNAREYEKSLQQQSSSSNQ